MKEKFTKFMKKHHAWDEFKVEIRPYTISDLTAQFEEAYEFLLCDGCIFFWRSAKTDIDWRVLNEKWEEHLKEETC